MFYNTLKRRHFLQGVGASLALPLLPSLLPEAHAALGDDKNLIYIGESHGGVNEEHAYPYRNPANEQVLYTGSATEGLDHRSRMEPLANFLQTRSSGLFPTTEHELSPVMGSFLNPHLSKINFIRGLDVMYYIAHHYGGYTGNFHAAAEPSGNIAPMETIEHIIARSSAFYRNRPLLPIMNIGSGRSISYSLQSGNISAMNTEDNWTLINSILGSNQPITDTARMTQYLNSIHADYTQLLSGSSGAARRLSSSDRLRVEEHLSLLNEVSNKIVNQGGASCPNTFSLVNDDPAHYWPNNLTQAQKIARWENTTNLIVAAIRCGASRIATMEVNPHLDFEGDWHQAIPHRQLGENNPEVLRLLVENMRFTAQNIFTRLVAKLDVDRGDGTTYLDNSLVCWVPESGPITHDFIDNFALTAGSAGGYFRTGNYVDYRNLSNLGTVGHDSSRMQSRRPGLPYNRWLYTVLKSMGIPDGEFSRAGSYGYGDNYIDRSNNSWFTNHNGHRAWPDRLLPDMSTPMPRITA